VRIEAATRQGRVRGRAGRDGVSFLGIPYARAPRARLRLRPPEPPEPWSGVADATRPGPASLQEPPDHVASLPALALAAQDEDCLSLNVFTPDADGARRPVLVWLHGGGFDWGAGSQPLFDGGRLARRGDAVVVSINYRLGALGFAAVAALGDRSLARPNLGLLDQVAALAWVRENVAAFGGDPEHVTIFGESAGAISIAALLAMPDAAGLFQRAILQSGSAQPLHDVETAAAIARGFLDELWLEPGEADQLAMVPPESIVAAQRAVTLRLRSTPDWLAWQPYVDGVVLPNEPLAAVRAGAARGIPLLVGTNRDECRPLVTIDGRLRPASERALYARIGEIAAEATDPERVLAAYRRVAGDRARLDDLASAIETDAHFRLPAIRLAEAQARHEPRTFMYRFDWPSPALGGALGACHGLEVPFVFGRTDAEGLAGLVGDGPEARALADGMMDAWIAFARSGDPSCPALGAWPAYDAALRATMRLGASCGVEHDPGGIERRAWPASADVVAPSGTPGSRRLRLRPLCGPVRPIGGDAR